MSLDDAIIYAEDMARINEVEAKVHKAKGHIGSEYTCIGVAEHHRQVAEWLRELKKYREILTRLDAMIDCYENCESCQGFREYPTSQFVKDVIQINKEVNADEKL